MACVRVGVGDRISERMARRVGKTKSARQKSTKNGVFGMDYGVIGELRRPTGRSNVFSAP